MDKTKISAVILLMLVLYFLSPLLFTVNSITGNYGDIQNHYYPLKYLVKEHIINGSLPLWNPYIMAGQPLLANPQSAVFYPLSMFFYIFSLHTAFNYFAAIHIFAAGLFMYLALSYLRFSRTASLLGSIALAFSSFLVYKIPSGHPVALSGYALFPAVILASEYMRREKNALSVILMSLITSFQFLSGHAQPVYISGVFILMHLSFNKFEYLKEFLCAFALALCLSSLQLIPVIELSGEIEKSIWPGLVKNYSMPFKNLINILFPDYFGNIVRETFIYPMNPSFFFERHAVYFGIIPLFLALSGLYYFVKEKKYFIPSVALIGIFIALGFNNPLYRIMYTIAPGLDLLRVPARFYFLSLPALLMLAAGAWDRYFSGGGKFLKVLLLLITVVDLFLWGNKFVYAAKIDDYAKSSLLSSFLSPDYRILTEPGIVQPNRAMLYHHYNLNGYEAILLKNFTRYLGLQEKKVLNASGLERSDIFSPLARGLSVRFIFTPNTISSGLGEVIFTSQEGVNLYKLFNPSKRVFLAETVKIIPENDSAAAYLAVTKLPPEKETVTQASPEWFINGPAGSTILSSTYGSSKITVEAGLKKPSCMVFSEMYYPGWRLAAGGKKYKVIKADMSLRAVFLPEGSYSGVNSIFMYFNPLSFSAGLLITVITVLTLLFYSTKRFINDLHSAGGVQRRT